jgi:hypothetical protein
MQNRYFAPKAGLLSVLLPIALTAVIHAQTASPQPAATQPPVAQVKPLLDPQANSAMLQNASALYYSSTKAGLDGFDCTIHPDWRTVFLSVDKGISLADDDPRLVVLNAVNVVLHARMKGGSTVEWTPPPADPAKPISQDLSGLRDQMRLAVDQTLTGFMQIWTPFADDSIIPASSEGLEISKTPEAGIRVYGEEGGAKMTETFDSHMVMQQYNVDISGNKVDFSPTFIPSDQGMLVTKFLAHIQPAGTPPEQSQEMHVSIAYQTVDGIQIPAKIGMEVAHSATLNFTLDGCQVSRQAR